MRKTQTVTVNVKQNFNKITETKLYVKIILTMDFFSGKNVLFGQEEHANKLDIRVNKQSLFPFKSFVSVRLSMIFLIGRVRENRSGREIMCNAFWAVKTTGNQKKLM